MGPQNKAVSGNDLLAGFVSESIQSIDRSVRDHRGSRKTVDFYYCILSLLYGPHMQRNDDTLASLMAVCHPIPRKGMDFACQSIRKVDTQFCEFARRRSGLSKVCGLPSGYGFFIQICFVVAWSEGAVEVTAWFLVTKPKRAIFSR